MWVEPEPAVVDAVAPGAACEPVADAALEALDAAVAALLEAAGALGVLDGELERPWSTNSATPASTSTPARAI
jgi:hypothetical protein